MTYSMHNKQAHNNIYHVELNNATGRKDLASKIRINKINF